MQGGMHIFVGEKRKMNKMEETELRKYCVEAIIRNQSQLDISEIIRNADHLFKYIKDGEIPIEEKRTKAPLPGIPRDIPITPKPIPPKPVCG